MKSIKIIQVMLVFCGSASLFASEQAVSLRQRAAQRKAEQAIWWLKTASDQEIRDRVQAKMQQVQAARSLGRKKRMQEKGLDLANIQGKGFDALRKLVLTADKMTFEPGDEDTGAIIRNIRDQRQKLLGRRMERTAEQEKFLEPIASRAQRFLTRGLMQTMGRQEEALLGYEELVPKLVPQAQLQQVVTRAREALGQRAEKIVELERMVGTLRQQLQQQAQEAREQAQRDTDAIADQLTQALGRAKQAEDARDAAEAAAQAADQQLAAQAAQDVAAQRARADTAERELREAREQLQQVLAEREQAQIGAEGAAAQLVDAQRRADTAEAALREARGQLQQAQRRPEQAAAAVQTEALRPDVTEIGVQAVPVVAEAGVSPIVQPGVAAAAVQTEVPQPPVPALTPAVPDELERLGRQGIVGVEDVDFNDIMRLEAAERARLAQMLRRPDIDEGEPVSIAERPIRARARPEPLPEPDSDQIAVIRPPVPTEPGEDDDATTVLMPPPSVVPPTIAAADTVTPSAPPTIVSRPPQPGAAIADIVEPGAPDDIRARLLAMQEALERQQIMTQELGGQVGLQDVALQLRLAQQRQDLAGVLDEFGIQAEARAQQLQQQMRQHTKDMIAQMQRTGELNPTAGLASPKNRSALIKIAATGGIVAAVAVALGLGIGLPLGDIADALGNAQDRGDLTITENPTAPEGLTIDLGGIDVTPRIASIVGSDVLKDIADASATGGAISQEALSDVGTWW